MYLAGESGHLPMEIRNYASEDLDAVLRLCEREGWPSLPQDPARAHRALTAPGVTTLVAGADERIVGFAQVLSDGEIQAYLCLIAVDPEYRRRGIARSLIETALKVAGGVRLDLLTDSADDFYRSMPHFQFSGFRLYPDYSGPDIYRPEVQWKNGRIADEGTQQHGESDQGT
jgi:ribosomal protein S18 acetylase RimI-like enzyme